MKLIIVEEVPFKCQVSSKIFILLVYFVFEKYSSVAFCPMKCFVTASKASNYCDVRYICCRDVSALSRETSG